MPTEALGLHKGNTANHHPIALGARIAAERKAQDITQVELAERLRISQQARISFEKGRQRVLASLLPAIAQNLNTTLDALIAHRAAPAAAPKKHRPQKKLRQQLEMIEALPIVEQRAIVRVLDSVLAWASVTKAKH
jgi:transcriptional regulator with XRE-family HTH domain